MLKRSYQFPMEFILQKESYSSVSTLNNKEGITSLKLLLCHKDTANAVLNYQLNKK